jgi:hypothetical protein
MSLEEKLEKMKKDREKANIDWSDRREKWIEAYNKMINDSKTWLTPLEERGLLELGEAKKDLDEENIGKYELRCLIIGIEETQIAIAPMGTIISGALGRADIINLRKNENKMLVLMGDNFDSAIWKLYYSKVPARLLEGSL